MRRLLAAFVIAASCTGSAHAGPLIVGAGGGVGVTPNPPANYATFSAGALGNADLALIPRLSMHATLRGQIYAHPEDEDHGSWGSWVDLTAGLRVDVFRKSEKRSMRPFVALRSGPAWVHRVPYCTCASEEIIGVVVGGSLGVDFMSRKTPLRVQLSYDRPSLTTHDDTGAPTGALSLAVMFVLPE